MKLQLCSRELINWSAKQRRDTYKEIEEKQLRLDQLQKLKGPKDNEAIRALEEDLALLLEKEDIKWKQQAKRDWYHLGDLNTRYFHSCASQRKKKNWVHSIQDHTNRKVSSHSESDQVFQLYFHNLFSTSSPSQQALDDCLQQVQPSVTTAMNANLTEIYTEEKIKAAIIQMAPLKSPGLNGFNASFFQNYWHIMGEEVSSVAPNFINHGIFDRHINKTFIVHIPKINTLLKLVILAL